MRETLQLLAVFGQLQVIHTSNHIYTDRILQRLVKVDSRSHVDHQVHVLGHLPVLLVRHAEVRFDLR